MILPGLTFWQLAIFYVFLFLIITLPYNLVYGTAGIPDFGRAMSAGIGGYLTAMLTLRLCMAILGISGRLNFFTSGDVTNALGTRPGVGLGVFIVVLIASVIAGGALGFAASFTLFRGLRGFRFAITLLSIQMIIRQVMYFSPLIGGRHGLPLPNLFAWAPIDSMYILLLVAGGICALYFFYINFLAHSPLGRLLKAIREDAESVRALGRDPNMTLIRTMGVTYAMSAVAGALYAIMTQHVVGNGFKRVQWCFLPLAMIVLGGRSNNRGVIVGTTIFVLLRRFLKLYKSAMAPFLPFDPFRIINLILGVTLMGVMIVKPLGIMPEETELTFDPGTIEEIRGRRTSE